MQLSVASPGVGRLPIVLAGRQTRRWSSAASIGSASSGSTASVLRTLDRKYATCVDPDDARRPSMPVNLPSLIRLARWGRYWHGSPRKPHQFALGDDGGCFQAALAAVRRWGGVLEHPADSKAWPRFGLNRPPRLGGWVNADFDGGWTCYVEQGHYGHMARKGTWLYACLPALPDLRWGPSEQRLPAYAVERYGYAKARRIGVMAAVGGKNKTAIRDATPPEFRDILLSMVRTNA